MRILSIRKTVSNCTECPYLHPVYIDDDRGEDDWQCHHPDGSYAQLTCVRLDAREEALAKTGGFLPGCPLKEGVV